MRFYLGVDVGTGSARAGVFDDAGIMHGMGVCAIETWRPSEDHVEQSSEDIWSACGAAVRSALGEAKIAPEMIAGIGFDATCSLVVLDADDRPVTVSRTGKDAQNVVVWMDHRALDQTSRINAGAHDVLRYVGGVMSPEMETPKLLWLKENLPSSWRRAARFLDLPDFLVYRATGEDVRSLCTTTCKWTYLGHEGRWDEAFFRDVGLGDLADERFARIGTRVRPMGDRAGTLTRKAATELGLTAGTPVAVAIIDAHAGGVGMIGVTLNDVAPDQDALERRLALIGGTSSCHMAVSREPRFVPGVWGPYFSSMVPGMWLTEGGQSATGALIDHVLAAHTRGTALAGAGASVHAVLAERLDVLAQRSRFPAEVTRDLHVLPDHHGNRSPRADPTLRGMISGLKLTSGLDALALEYLATLQAIAHGTKHIVDAMNARGYAIDTLVACGGDTKNPLFLREHADVTGCRIVLPKEPEAVLLGAAILGAVASGTRASVIEAMGAMTKPGRILEPAGGEVAEFHARKHAVFLRMHDDQVAYRATMRGDAGA